MSAIFTFYTCNGAKTFFRLLRGVSSVEFCFDANSAVLSARKLKFWFPTSIEYTIFGSDSELLGYPLRKVSEILPFEPLETVFMALTVLSCFLESILEQHLDSKF
jgi:hypothetical protein